MHRIEISIKSQFPDARGLGLVKDIHDLGIKTAQSARVIDIYWLDASLSDKEVELVCHGLLADGVTQDYKFFTGKMPAAPPGSIEVVYNAGVADPVEASILKAIRDLGVTGVKAVKTAKQYIIQGKLSKAQMDLIAGRLLVNPIVQHVAEGEQAVFPENPRYKFKRVEIPILGATPEFLKDACRQYYFTSDELKTVAAYFWDQGRNPTDVELETVAQTWSEHCGHKTFKSKITFDGKVIDNLLKSTIARATRELDKPWCLSVFSDNAGVIDFDGKNALCFKVETHNHPSAVEPYGGAATGIGGVIRDPLGTGLGAKPIANTDVFCFAPPDYPYEKLPPGALHPRRVFKGVRAGVADYGNRMGIPTLNGAVLFDDRYVGNPLVYCGTLGIMPVDVVERGKESIGDMVMLIGGRTGRDGIHGVTFASENLTDASTTKSQSAVQIGNAIVEKKFLDVLLKARDRRLFSRITDVGGGGLSSAVGEMTAEVGVRVDLEKVPLKYAGLSYAEIWVSESQERMVMTVPPQNVAELTKMFTDEDVESTIIGECTGDRRLKLYYNTNLVCDMAMDFLHNGLPQMDRDAEWHLKIHKEPDFPVPKNLGAELKNVLGSLNVCSKEWVIRQYDHEVQGGSVLKAMVGTANDGPGDAAIIRPVLSSKKGAIISCGVNVRYGDIDPYWMAASVIEEALRQIIAVGGNLERVALLDNFSWGNTGNPEMLGALVRACQACYDMAKGFGTPFISGKDSLNNEYEFEGKTIPIPHTLLISAVGVMDDTSKAITMDFKQPGDLVYLVGLTRPELGGSEYFGAHGFIGNDIPEVDAEISRYTMNKLSQATGKGLVRACHDISDGGIAVALAEMAFAGGFGAEIELSRVPPGEPMDRDDYILFSESNGRFLVEVTPENKLEFEKTVRGMPVSQLGTVTADDSLVVHGLLGKTVIDEKLADLKEAWQKTLRW